MTQESQARIRQMTEELRRLDASHTESIRRLREEVTAEMQRNVEAIRQASQQSQVQRTRLLQELQQMNWELQEEVDRLRRQQDRQQESGRAAAEQLLERAQAQAAAVDAEPHQLFCPSQFEVLQEHLFTAVRMLEMRLYDTAAAMADAAWTEFELLGIQVRERQREWEQVYHIYAAIASDMYQAMEAFEADAIQTPLGSFILGEGDRAYWSRDQYQPIRDSVAEAYRLVENIRNADSITAFLRTHTVLRGFAMNNQISTLCRLNEQLTAVTLCIRNELFYSDQRCQIAEKAGNLLHTMGYQVCQPRFRGDPEDLLDCCELTATINRIDTLTLMFVPQREDGIVVRNICILVPDIQTLPNPELIQGEAQELLKVLRQELAVQAVWYPTDSVQLPLVEQQFKRQADARQLARKLERKYQ